MNFFVCSNMRSLKSSIESIATRAGVGKTTIYRRWESKEYLIIEALSHLRTEMPILDAGNLREDLFALLRSASQVVNPLLVHDLIDGAGWYRIVAWTFTKCDIWLRFPR